MDVQVEAIDLRSPRDVRRFVDLPYSLYAGNERWVPPLRGDALAQLNPRRHPFYDHADAAFFIARYRGQDAGRIAVFEHRPHNEAHGIRQAWFGLFESLDEPAVSGALFARGCEWARGRRLDRLTGPRGLGALDGYGVLVDAFDRRQLMTMTSYNPEYYPRHLERFGFGKEVDFVSFRLHRDTFVMPEAIKEAALRAAPELRIVRYASRRELVRAARRIGDTYNRAFAANWEYYPMTQREVDFVVGQVRPIADPRLMTFIAAKDEIVGFLLAFPDVSSALQKMNGRLSPVGVVRLLIERSRTPVVALNGAGIVPEYQGRGGNALLYVQIEQAIRASQFREAELPQVAETAARMRRDLARLGAQPVKTHRVYTRAI
jgi:hypothetical protein